MFQDKKSKSKINSKNIAKRQTVWSPPHQRGPVLPDAKFVKILRCGTLSISNVKEKDISRDI